MTRKDFLDAIRRARSAGRQDIALDAVRRLIASGLALQGDGAELLDHALALADEDGALEIAKAMLRETPGDPQVTLLLAERYARIGRSDIALDLVTGLRADAPPNPAIDYFHSVYSGHVGHLEDAAKSARLAISAKPDFGDAWAVLASTGQIKPDDGARLEALLDQRAPHALPGAAYALGALRHKQGDTAQAWQAWTLANQSERAKAPFARDREVGAMRAIAAAFDTPGDAVSPRAPESGAPIFVVGAPRSGTSLTEQIIASAPGVFAMGETMFSRVATWPLGNLTGPDIARASAAAGGGIDWARLGAVYRTLSRIRSQGAARVTDKGAILHLFVGALARCLPEARFVWVRRDPRDVALSAYRTYLTDGARWRHDPMDAAAFLHAHEDLMAIWAAAFPDRVYRLDYEALVSQPEPQVTRLMAFLGLPAPDYAALDLSGATVSTASFAQIRGQISAHSVGGWRAYAAYLDPAFSRAARPF